MSSEWREITFGEFITIQRGHDLPDQERRPGKVPILGSFGVTGFHDTIKANGPGVTIGRSGSSFGVATYTDEDYWPLNTTLYVTDFKSNDPKFVYYFLKLFDFSGYNSGSAQPSLNRNNLYGISIRVPSPPTQKQIATFVSSFDDRIAILHDTNATLEAIAQALFKSWFVDFDPVHAKQQGRAPEGMDEVTAALFPDCFEESELGLVPRGWQIGSIEDLCDVITNGGTPSRSKKQFWEGGSIPWYKTGDFSDGFLLTPSEFITEEALKGSAAKLLPENAVLMAIYAAPTVGRLAILTEPATFNQACTGMVAKAEVGPWFLYWTLYFGREWFNSRANGAAQQNISKAIVASYRTIIPPKQVLLAFNVVLSALHSKIRTTNEQAQTLSTLRNTLLPRLISGQLHLPEAEVEIDKEMR